MKKSEMNETNFVKDLSDFSAALHKYEVDTYSKFVVIKTKNFNEKVELDIHMKLLWEGDLPYFLFGSKIYACRHGKDHNKSSKQKYAESRDNKGDSNVPIKRYNTKQPTKKLDCPVKFTLKKVVIFPEFRVRDIHNKQGKLIASQTVKTTIWERFGTPDKTGEEGFLFQLPKITEHKNHITGPESAVTEPIDSRISQFIADVVRDGERNIESISKLTYEYAKDSLKEIDTSRKRFYPSTKTIRNFVSRMKLKLNSVPMDQDLQALEYEANTITKRDMLLEHLNSNLATLRSIVNNLEDEKIESVICNIKYIIKECESDVTRCSNGLPTQWSMQKNPSRKTYNQDNESESSDLTVNSEKIRSDHQNYIIAYSDSREVAENISIPE